MSKINRYKEEELNFIKSNALNMRPKEIAQFLNRSRQSIEQQAKKLDVKLKPYYREPENIQYKRFGKLIAIKFIGRKKRRSRWECQCDCGKLVNVEITSLKSGNTTSCGCSRIVDIERHIGKRTYGQHLNNCKRRNYINFLTIEQFIEIAKRNCTYCKKISVRTNRNTGETFEMNSVDRIDNEPYYKLENCQSVCFTCQTMKMDMTHDEFILHIKNIIKNYED